MVEESSKVRLQFTTAAPVGGWGVDDGQISNVVDGLACGIGIPEYEDAFSSNVEKFILHDAPTGVPPAMNLSFRQFYRLYQWRLSKPPLF